MNIGEIWLGFIYLKSVRKHSRTWRIVSHGFQKRRHKKIELLRYDTGFLRTKLLGERVGEEEEHQLVQRELYPPVELS